MNPLISARIIANDALVVLCLNDLQDSMTHHEFKIRASTRGFILTKSDCHNMLHRALGRVRIAVNDRWMLTASGLAYRDACVEVFTSLVGWSTQTRKDRLDATENLY